jgi:molybdopterin-biosynthesis enzyme MoeA-like protein
MTPDSTPQPAFGLIVIGDEILSGRRADKHLAKVIELLVARGRQLAWAEYIGDDPAQITATLRRALASGDVVFSTGGIGATPDDHTRQCAAAALGVPLALHPEARRLILERLESVARAEGVPWEPERADNQHRLNMGVFPVGAEIIPNPYNQIPGFSCRAPSQARSARPGVDGAVPASMAPAIHFVPGFPVMAWPMIEWVLEERCGLRPQPANWVERSIIVFGAGEAVLTPVMVRVEAEHPRVKVFSLPSVDHPTWGRHIDLGVKGPPEAVGPAYTDLLAWLQPFGLRYGPELTRP